MPVRQKIAEAVGSVLTWGLRNVARRPAANTPGLIGLKIDPKLICELRSRMHKGCIVVVGTNGKTTVNNLLANVLQQKGFSVLCNRTGANLNSGIASALLQSKGADWGVLECDELWSAKIVPQIEPDYFLLLNLFRDQLDRCGEIDHIQDAIVSGIIASPKTRLIYNADDPLCEMIARRVQESRTDESVQGSSADAFPLPISFGTSQSLSLDQNRVADATMCQVCSHMFEYEFRQYGQLGSYLCPNCGFKRPELDFEAFNIDLRPRDLTLSIRYEKDAPIADRSTEQFGLHTSLNGTYMIYNLLAVSSAAITIGCDPEDIQTAVDAFNPKNGRLQEYCIDGHRTLLNLAKNPTGFNQNLRIVTADERPKAVAFFINDKVVDGHDISWIWDIDFEELAGQDGTVVFAGGTRSSDLRVRLKYAGIDAGIITGIEDVFDFLKSDDANLLGSDAAVYAIANYTALPPVHDKLGALQAQQSGSPCLSGSDESTEKGPSAGSGMVERAHASASKIHDGADDPDPNGRGITNDIDQDSRTSDPKQTVVIAHILPDLLNLYGDGGNVRILEQRLRWRDIPVEVRRMEYSDPIDLTGVDIVVLGGSPDREQRLALERMKDVRDDLKEYVENGGVLLSICGGYQMLGRTWILDGEEVDGLDILPIDTRRSGASTDRLIDNIAVKSSIAGMPVIGYENHSGRTYIDDDAVPFGKVVSKVGHGNNDSTTVESKDRGDGIVYKNAIGTYLHGPLLSKNPEVADWLIERALSESGKDGYLPLAKLDDSAEIEANGSMAKRII